MLRSCQEIEGKILAFVTGFAEAFHSLGVSASSNISMYMLHVR